MHPAFQSFFVNMPGKVEAAPTRSRSARGAGTLALARFYNRGPSANRIELD
jgi:hypothetical protein